MTSHLMKNMIELLLPDQVDERDLRRDPESHRRSPIPRAAASVDPHAAEAMESRDERLLQAHQKIPRPELARTGRRACARRAAAGSPRLPRKAQSAVDGRAAPSARGEARLSPPRGDRSSVRDRNGARTSP